MMRMSGWEGFNRRRVSVLGTVNSGSKAGLFSGSGMGMGELELEDMQGMLASGYGDLKCSRFLFLRFGGPAKADATKKWLAGLVNLVTTAGFRREKSQRVGLPQAVQIALGRPGLEALGLDDGVLRTFAPEFYEGMAGKGRAELLGDHGKSAPKGWELGGPGREVHALLMLYAGTARRLETLSRGQERNFRAAGIKLLHAVDGSFHPEPGLEENEHFGFRDGISQPRIRGLDKTRSSRTNVVQPGEFIFGYKGENGTPPTSPSVLNKADPGDVLPRSRFRGRKDLGRNGSYLVFRKLSQDVRGFWSYFHQQASGEYSSEARDAMAVKLASKAMGRWPSGAPLVLAPDKDDPELGRSRRNNRFLFHKADPEGLKCPIGSHMRRANPRDSLTAAFWPDASDPKASLKISNRHRILRRGRPYGTFLKDPRARRPESGDRGLLFFCVNTDLGRQFEFIQHTWLINPKFAGLAHDGDPVCGDNDGVHDGQMTMQGCPVREKLHGLPRFVRVRGGAYLFLPGIRALRYLSGAV